MWSKSLCHCSKTQNTMMVQAVAKVPIRISDAFKLVYTFGLPPPFFSWEITFLKAETKKPKQIQTPPCLQPLWDFDSFSCDNSWVSGSWIEELVIVCSVECYPLSLAMMLANLCSFSQKGSWSAICQIHCWRCLHLALLDILFGLRLTWMLTENMS